jgi:hypothetical protein
MPSEGKDFSKLIGRLLRQQFQATVDQPLPPLIQQTIRRLRQLDEAAESPEDREPLAPKRWNLVVPRRGRSHPPRG